MLQLALVAYYVQNSKKGLHLLKIYSDIAVNHILCICLLWCFIFYLYEFANYDQGQKRNFWPTNLLPALEARGQVSKLADMLCDDSKNISKAKYSNENPDLMSIATSTGTNA